MFWRRRGKEERAHLSLSLETGRLSFTLVRSSRRTLGVQVLKDGAVVVRAPRRLPEAEIARFLEDKSRWIARHRSRLSENRKPPLRFCDGAAHPWLGKNLILKVERGQRAFAKFSGEAICVRVPEPLNGSQVERAVKALYKRSALEVFGARLDALFPAFAAMGHARPKIKTRWMRRNFGSMSRKGVMTLNLALLRKPVALIDYVIVHELCHMEHMNHGRGFYALMDDVMPDWKAHKAALHGAVD